MNSCVLFSNELHHYTIGLFVYMQKQGMYETGEVSILCGRNVSDFDKNKRIRSEY